MSGTKGAIITRIFFSQLDNIYDEQYNTNVKHIMQYNAQTCTLYIQIRKIVHCLVHRAARPDGEAVR